MTARTVARLYHRADGRGTQRVYRVVLCNPRKAKAELLDRAHVSVPPRDADGCYRLEDGHLQEFQPRVSRVAAEAWLASNPSGFAVLINGMEVGV